jgi:hypothetical protein
MPRLVIALVLCAAACSPRVADPIADAGTPPDAGTTAENRLALVVPDLIELDDGQQTLILFTVVFAQAPVSFSVTQLPAFATFGQDRLVLKPRHLVDAGEYWIEITATDGQQTDQKIIHVLVSRPHTPPYLAPLFFMSGCPMWSCSNCGSFPGTWVSNYVKDADLEPAKLEFEIVPDGASFTQTVTQASGFLPMAGSESIAQFVVTLTGLTEGAWYRGRHRAVDQSGQTSEWIDLCNGGAFLALP